MDEFAEVEVRPSTIEGLGLFARRAFAAGGRVRRINVVREVTPESPLREDLGERSDHCDYPDGRVVLLGFPDRHVNHSCDPNAYVLYEADACVLVARRPIAAGEEITCDYAVNLTGGTAWPCHCGAARCRGTTLGDFFLLPQEIQREYRPLLADWFVKRNAARLGAPGEDGMDRSTDDTIEAPEPAEPASTEKKRSWVPWFWDPPSWEMEEQLAEYQTLGWAKSYRKMSVLLLLLLVAINFLVLLVPVIRVTAAGVVLNAILYGGLAIFVYRGGRPAIVIAMVLFTLDRGFVLARSVLNPLAWLINLPWWMFYMQYLWRALKVEQARRAARVTEAP